MSGSFPPEALLDVGGDQRNGLLDDRDGDSFQVALNPGAVSDNYESDDDEDEEEGLGRVGRGGSVHSPIPEGPASPSTAPTIALVGPSAAIPPSGLPNAAGSSGYSLVSSETTV